MSKQINNLEELEREYERFIKTAEGQKWKKKWEEKNTR